MARRRKAAAQFDEAMTVAKLRGARERKRCKTGGKAGRTSATSGLPLTADLPVANALCVRGQKQKSVDRLRRYRPIGSQLSAPPCGRSSSLSTSAAPTRLRRIAVSSASLNS